MRTVYLTTKDNPYDPCDNFDEWYLFDMDHGYNCCGMVARLSLQSDALSIQEQIDELERTIDEIIALDFTNNYVKLEKDEPMANFNFNNTSESLEFTANPTLFG